MEKRGLVGARKGSYGMVEMNVMEKRRCVGAKKGSHGMVDIRLLCFRWFSPFFTRVQKGFPGFA
jgi:hypothetical protein